MPVSQSHVLQTLQAPVLQQGTQNAVSMQAALAPTMTVSVTMDATVMEIAVKTLTKLVRYQQQMTRKVATFYRISRIAIGIPKMNNRKSLGCG